MKTLLAIGDWKDFDTYRKFCKNKRYFSKSHIKFKTTNYWYVIRGILPEIKTKEIIILPCFPFRYWDYYIEPKNYEGIYGNKSFYTKFLRFWIRVQQEINWKYKDKKITYINHPKNLAIDRDKKLTKQLVAKKGVKVPRNFKAKNSNDILKLLKKGKKLFIKVRYGSMGKGITYLEKGNWQTNFRFRNNKIISKKSDYGWSFINITGKRRYITEILKHDVIIEEAIDPLLINNRKFDLRLYVYKNKVLYTYARSNENKKPTTNISQGAKGETQSFLNKLSKSQLRQAEKAAINSIKALGLNFGGVDLMFHANKKDVMFIEVNTFPGFPKVRSYNLSKYLIKEIIKDY